MLRHKKTEVYNDKHMPTWTKSQMIMQDKKTTNRMRWEGDLESNDSSALEAQIVLEVLGDLTDQALEK